MLLECKHIELTSAVVVITAASLIINSNRWLPIYTYRCNHWFTLHMCCGHFAVFTHLCGAVVLLPGFTILFRTKIDYYQL